LAISCGRYKCFAFSRSSFLEIDDGFRWLCSGGRLSDWPFCIGAESFGHFVTDIFGLSFFFIETARLEIVCFLIAALVARKTNNEMKKQNSSKFPK